MFTFFHAVVEAVRNTVVKSVREPVVKSLRDAVAEAIRTEQAGQAHSEQQAPLATPSNTRIELQIPNIELQIPQSLTTQYEANAKSQKGYQVGNLWLGSIAVVISTAALVLLIIYATLTLRLWQAQIESNDEQRTTLEVANRAYLSLGPLESQELGTFALPVSNGGHVPASYSITLDFTRLLLDERHRPIGKPLVGNLESPGNGTVQPGTTNYIIVGMPTNRFSARERTLLLHGYENASLRITLTYDTGFGKRDQVSTVACFYEPQGGLRWNQLCGSANMLDLGQAAKYHTYKEDPAN